MEKEIKLPKWWGKIKWFRPYEFDSMDDPGLILDVKQGLVQFLDTLRESCGFPLKINSGIRSPEENKSVGGYPNSSHLRGWAVDIQCMTSRARFMIVQNALMFGAKRIGIGATFIHIDLDPSLDQRVIWTYQ